MQKADHHVGDLHTSVVNVVLYLNFFAGVAQDTRDGVAEYGVAEVADVGSLVGIDAGVLDDDFFRAEGRLGGLSRVKYAPERAAIKEDVEIAGAGDFDACDTRWKRKAGCDFLSDLARRTLQLLG